MTAKDKFLKICPNAIEKQTASSVIIEDSKNGYVYARVSQRRPSWAWAEALRRQQIYKSMHKDERITQ